MLPVGSGHAHAPDELALGRRAIDTASTPGKSHASVAPLGIGRPEWQRAPPSSVGKDVEPADVGFESSHLPPEFGVVAPERRLFNDSADVRQCGNPVGPSTSF